MARGGVVRFCEKDVLDTFLPSWGHTDPATFDATAYYAHYMHDDRDPTRFYLYPRPNPAYSVWVLYAAVPTSLAALSETYPLASKYEQATIDYVLYRALLKEGRYSSSSGEKRGELYNVFLRSLGLRRQAEREVGAGNNRPPEATA